MKNLERLLRSILPGLLLAAAMLFAVMVAAREQLKVVPAALRNLAQ